MVVDLVAALQGLIDAQDSNPVGNTHTAQVIALMQQISVRGTVGRQIFDLNEFLEKGSKIDFGQNTYQAVLLVELVGQCLSRGLIVATGENQVSRAN